MLKITKKWILSLAEGKLFELVNFHRQKISFTNTILNLTHNRDQLVIIFFVPAYICIGLFELPAEPKYHIKYYG